MSLKNGQMQQRITSHNITSSDDLQTNDRLRLISITVLSHSAKTSERKGSTVLKDLPLHNHAV